MSSASNKTKSRNLFFLGCVPARILIAYIAYLLSDTCCSKKGESVKNYRILFAAFTFLIGVGMLTIYLMGWRKKGQETFGEDIWWNNLRPIHAFLYISFSIGLMTGVNNIYMLLVYDVIIGILAELFYKK